ncbi:MAG: response regulator [Hyphomonadaceae bacterium]
MAVSRALVLDDDAHMRMLLGVLLRQDGVDSVAVSTAAEATAALGGVERFAVALVDVDLQGDDGLDMVRALRRDRVSRNWRIPVVVISGWGNPAVIQRARDAGADGFLLKPITARALTDKIEAATRRRRAFIDAPDFCGPDRRVGENGDYPGPERRHGDALYI